MSGIRRVRSLCRGVGGLALIAVLASCSKSSGNAETDRIATVVATAISSPHQDSADGFVRAALATHAGVDSRLTVVEVEELHADEPVDPLARLVFQVHLKGNGSWFGPNAGPITACYEAQFSFYGIIGSPHRIDCPAGATAILPTPLALEQSIPEDFDTTLAELLAALPAAPNAPEVSTLVAGGLPEPGVDPNTGLRDLPPTVEAAVHGADVGVSLWAPLSRDCLLGARIGGQVTVWRPPQPNPELGTELPPCDPQTALQLLGTGQPQ